ncbi:MAG: hypothetical protein ACREO8_09650 [Luteimonas sp.]
MCSTAYPTLRASLSADYAELNDEQLDLLVAEIYGTGISAEDIESFWSDVGRGFQTVGRVAGRALPSIAQGAMAGSALGPWGVLAGAVAGGAGSVLSQTNNPTLRGIGGAIGGVTRLAGSVTGGGAVGNLAGGALGSLASGALGGRGGRGGRRRRGGGGGALGNIASGALGALGQRGGAAGAIAQIAGAVAPQLAGALAAGGGAGGSANALIGLLSRPETLRALSAAAMGPYGRSQVPVGQQPVSVQSILGALGTLAGRASSEAESISDRHPAYYYAADGELAFDPADSEQRALALLELYENTPSPHWAEAWQAGASASGENDESDEYDEYDEAEYGDEDAIYDEWLLANEAELSEYDEYEESAHA